MKTALFLSILCLFIGCDTQDSAKPKKPATLSLLLSADHPTVQFLAFDLVTMKLYERDRGWVTLFENQDISVEWSGLSNQQELLTQFSVAEGVYEKIKIEADLKDTDLRVISEGSWESPRLHSSYGALLENDGQFVMESHFAGGQPLVIELAEQYSLGIQLDVEASSRLLSVDSDNSLAYAFTPVFNFNIGQSRANYAFGLGLLSNKQGELYFQPGHYVPESEKFLLAASENTQYRLNGSASDKQTLLNSLQEQSTAFARVTLLDNEALLVNVVQGESAFYYKGMASSTAKFSGTKLRLTNAGRISSFSSLSLTRFNRSSLPASIFHFSAKANLSDLLLEDVELGVMTLRSSNLFSENNQQKATPDALSYYDGIYLLDDTGAITIKGQSPISSNDEWYEMTGIFDEGDFILSEPLGLATNGQRHAQLLPINAEQSLVKAIEEDAIQLASFSANEAIDYSRDYGSLSVLEPEDNSLQVIKLPPLLEEAMCIVEGDDSLTQVQYQNIQRKAFLAFISERLQEGYKAGAFYATGSRYEAELYAHKIKIFLINPSDTKASKLQGPESTATVLRGVSGQVKGTPVKFAKMVKHAGKYIKDNKVILKKPRSKEDKSFFKAAKFMALSAVDRQNQAAKERFNEGSEAASKIRKMGLANPIFGSYFSEVFNTFLKSEKVNQTVYTSLEATRRIGQSLENSPFFKSLYNSPDEVSSKKMMLLLDSYFQGVSTGRLLTYEESELDSYFKRPENNFLKELLSIKRPSEFLTELKNTQNEGLKKLANQFPLVDLMLEQDKSGELKKLLISDTGTFKTLHEEYEKHVISVFDEGVEDDKTFAHKKQLGMTKLQGRNESDGLVNSDLTTYYEKLSKKIKQEKVTISPDIEYLNNRFTKSLKASLNVDAVRTESERAGLFKDFKATISSEAKDGKYSKLIASTPEDVDNNTPGTFSKAAFTKLNESYNFTPELMDQTWQIGVSKSVNNVDVRNLKRAPTVRR